MRDKPLIPSEFAVDWSLINRPKQERVFAFEQMQSWSCCVCLPLQINTAFGNPHVNPKSNKCAAWWVLTSAGDGVHPGPSVLHDGTGTTLHRQDTGYLQDDVLG